MNTDEKNRYISEQMGWIWVEKHELFNPHWQQPVGVRVFSNDFYVGVDHLSNAFAYVVPWLRKEKYLSITIIMPKGDTRSIVRVIDNSQNMTYGKSYYGISFDVHQAICDAFIEYCKDKK